MATEGKASEAVALLGIGETQGEAKRPNGGHPTLRPTRDCRLWFLESGSKLCPIRPGEKDSLALHLSTF